MLNVKQCLSINEIKLTTWGGILLIFQITATKCSSASNCAQEVKIIFAKINWLIFSFCFTCWWLLYSTDTAENNNNTLEMPSPLIHSIHRHVHNWTCDVIKLDVYPALWERQVRGMVPVRFRSVFTSNWSWSVSIIFPKTWANQKTIKSTALFLHSVIGWSHDILALFDWWDCGEMRLCHYRQIIIKVTYTKYRNRI